MNIFAKLFNVKGHQVLIRKASVEDDDKKYVPAVIFEMWFGDVDVVSSHIYKTEAARDKAFDELFSEESVSKRALEIIRIVHQ